MKGYLALIKRNMNMYLRNRTTVLFSLLSGAIIIGLNLAFLGGVNERYLSEFISIDQKQVTYIVVSWLMGGIVVVNAASVTLSALSIMVEDEEKHKMAAFLVAPISRLKLTLSYILAACANAFLMSILTLGISILYIFVSCGAWLPIDAVVKLVGIIIANIFSLVTFFSCIVIPIRTSSAFSVISTTVGTLIGFVAAIYLHMGSLSSGLQNILKVFPVLYGTAAAREVYSQQAVKDAFSGAPNEVIQGYKDFMGISIQWGTEKVSLSLCLLILVGSGIIFTILASAMLNYKRASDR